VPKELRGKQEVEPEKMEEKLSDNEVKLKKRLKRRMYKMEDKISDENE
jgi:LPS O-antigen subunit length determinant protein (WzzB/FepE family)